MAKNDDTSFFMQFYPKTWNLFTKKAKMANIGLSQVV